MKIAWRELMAFAAASDAWAAQHREETKLGYAIKRVRDQVTRLGEGLQERMADVEIDLCVTDDKDVVQRDAQGNLQFTRAGLKERNQRQRALLDEEFEVEPHLAAEPEGLTPAEVEAFAGLVIPGRADSAHG